MPNMNKFAALSVLAESKSALKVTDKKTNVHGGAKEKKDKPAAAAAPVVAKAASKAAPAAAAAAPKVAKAAAAAPVDPNAAKDLKSLAAVLKAEREAKAVAAAKAAEAKAIADAAAAEKAAADAEAAAKAAAEAPAPAEGETVAAVEGAEAAAEAAAPTGPKIIEIIKPEKKTLTLAEIEEERKKNSVKVVLKARAVDASALKGLEVLKKDDEDIKIVVKKPTTPATAKPGAKPAVKKGAAVVAPQPQVSEAREKGKALTLGEIQAMQAPRRGGYAGRGFGGPRPGFHAAAPTTGGFASPNVDDKHAFPSL